MQAGKLRHRVTILRPASSGQDTIGAVTPSTPAEIGERWAEIRPLSGRELWNAMQVNADLTHAIRLRGDALTTTIKASDRIRFGAREFEVASPPLNTDERDKEITFNCIERTNGA